MPRNPNAEKNNPCLREQELSYKCLDRNNFDREKCEVYFANYKNCRAFWDKVKTERRRAGLHPILPEVEDRPKIKEEYFKTKPRQQ